MVTEERLCSGNKRKLQQDCITHWSNLFIKFQKAVKCHVSVTNELTVLIYLPDVQCHGPVTHTDFISSFFAIKLISNNVVFVYWVPLSQHQCSFGSIYTDPAKSFQFYMVPHFELRNGIPCPVAVCTFISPLNGWAKYPYKYGTSLSFKSQWERPLFF